MITMYSRGIVVDNAKLITSKNNEDYLSFSIANHHYGNETSDTYFFKVLVFDKALLKQVKNCLTKGRDVIVEGKYSDKVWIKKNGEPTITRTLIADKIEYSKFKTYKKKEDVSDENADNKENKISE